ncbi:hypothetical protein PTKIN_Ptkin02bG0071500 [Pterospermum kingtungense]
MKENETQNSFFFCLDLINNLLFFHVWHYNKGQPLPKFGEWDVNDPSSAEGFTVIFNIARDEKRTGGNVTVEAVKPKKKHGAHKEKSRHKYSIKGKWFCFA